ncbi:MAG: hypothetical protein HQM09_23715 [Candidatus Riflebacteria bacterium]|nr:hypothetical protein [Candidatus Riflebacteria bacterium]
MFHWENNNSCAILSSMILTVTPNPLLDFILHEERPPTPGGHRVRSIKWTVGGKGINVARMLKTLGRPALALTFAGGPNGERIRSRLKDQGISAYFIQTEKETRSGINFVIDEPPSQTWWIEEGEPLTTVECMTMFEAVYREREKARFIAMSGSVPGPGQASFYRCLLEKIHGFNGEIYLDARGETLREATRVGGFFLKHNRDECLETFGLDPLNIADHPKLLSEFKRHGITGALITDGPRPATLLDHVSATYLLPPEIQEVSSVGSGDAALAGFIFARSEGKSLVESARWALAAGAADACHAGPCEASFPDIERLLGRVIIEKTVST